MILSDILQTGLPPESLAIHIADLVHQYQPDKFIGIGQELHRVKGMLERPAWFYETTEQFVKYHPFSMFRDEVILLKGARIFGFERIRDALQRKSHDTVLETNLGAVAHNLNVLRSLVAAGTRVMAMVKASSYGSGSFEIAGALQFHKTDYLAVAYADEGVELRKAGIGLPIMVMSPEPAAFETMIAHRLEPEIYSFSLLEKFVLTLDHNFPAMSGTYPIHLEVDTGMNRLGFSENEIPEMIHALNKTGRLRVVSVFSHLATAGDSSEQSFARQQIRSFESIRAQILEESDWSPAPWFHILNSDGIVNFPEAAYDMVRPGIGLYGFVSDPAICGQLRNVSTLRSVLTQIREVPAGSSVGYNRAFIAPRNMRVGIVAIGYADGFDRKLGNGNYQVRINGIHVPVIGDVCMDMLMVDLTTDPDAQVGDEVIIFDQHSPVLQMAKTLKTIPYEILTSVSPRVKRVYVTE
jgi:alanine racemase